MRWLLRPSLVAALSAAAVVGAFLIIWASGLFPAGGAPLGPLPVAAGEREIVWLYAATNPTAWERFVAAVRRSAERLQAAHPGLEAQVHPDEAFPRHTTAVPQVALAFPPGGPRLVFRWYKLTSDLKARDWIDALIRRRPPPLAIIGGSSSDAAREVAIHLRQAATALPEEERPLLLLTSASADRVQIDPGEADGRRIPAPVGEESEEGPGISLNDLYPGRTFRFCFSNRQMAAAVTRFLWTQDDLRPDADPVYMARWEDDSYSRDLVEGFWKALRALVAESAAGQWCWVTGCAGTGSSPGLAGGIFPRHRAGPKASRFSMSILPTPQVIDSSVGSFAQANHYEAKVARDLIDLLLSYEAAPRPPQERPLLVLTGQAQPSRRFLRALEGYAPYPSRRFVVATGDAIAFNTVYRDRKAAWPIQDLPFPLVFFCHHNPIDRAAGFRPDGESGAGPEEGPAATGTEEVLLYEDIVDALVQAGAAEADGAADLDRRLRGTRLGADGRVGLGPDGVLLFDDGGGRRSGTGEHVVCLRPRVLRVPRRQGEMAAELVLPEATIEVWAWRRLAGGHSWQRVGEPLRVRYDEFPGDGGGAHGID